MCTDVVCTDVEFFSSQHVSLKVVPISVERLYRYIVSSFTLYFTAYKYELIFIQIVAFVEEIYSK